MKCKRCLKEIPEKKALDGYACPYCHSLLEGFVYSCSCKKCENMKCEHQGKEWDRKRDVCNCPFFKDEQRCECGHLKSVHYEYGFFVGEPADGTMICNGFDEEGERCKCRKKKEIGG